MTTQALSDKSAPTTQGLGDQINPATEAQDLSDESALIIQCLGQSDTVMWF